MDLTWEREYVNKWEELQAQIVKKTYYNYYAREYLEWVELI